jgi:hypothetical protein
MFSSVGTIATTISAALAAPQQVDRGEYELSPLVQRVIETFNQWFGQWANFQGEETGRVSTAYTAASLPAAGAS